MPWQHKHEFMMIEGDPGIYQTLTPHNSIFHRRIPADFGYVVATQLQHKTHCCNKMFEISNLYLNFHLVCFIDALNS